MGNTFLVITSIAASEHPILKLFAKEAMESQVPFILIGDTKSPTDFKLEGCDFYSVDRQLQEDSKLSKILPFKHYARKNIGYLAAISKGAEIIIETDDDNWPLADFWEKRKRLANAHLLNNKGWVNIYKYFTSKHIWPRGFALEHIMDELPKLVETTEIVCPIQQGLADENPDVDAIYRLTLPLPFDFVKAESIALGENSYCPFNSQNTTWFKEAFPLLYLPSYCSFRMTDIWRSFVAQRVAWTCGWNILFHNSTVRQERNDHNLMKDFKDEISGYTNNLSIVDNLNNLQLEHGIEHIAENMFKCYEVFINMGLIENKERELLEAWFHDIASYI